MSIVDLARAALNEIPTSGILRERLSLAIDRLADAEAQVAALQLENGRLQAELDREREDHRKDKEELQRARDILAEEVRIHRSIAFTKGRRTGGLWVAFCPVCGAPADTSSVFINYSDKSCHWKLMFSAQDIPQFIREIESPA